MPNVKSALLPSLWMVLPVALMFAAPACGGAPDAGTKQDGLGASTTVTPSVGPSLGCASPSDGCPCAAEGAEVACKGPKIQSGNYTSCQPGVRFCTGGVWGACIGKTLYQNVDSLTQDYVSPCAAGTEVRWASLKLQGYAPEDSRIDVAVQSADSPSHLDTAPLMRAGSFDNEAQSPWTGIDVNRVLTAAGHGSAPFLRVTVSLVRASRNATSPSVAWQQGSECVPTK